MNKLKKSHNYFYGLIWIIFLSISCHKNDIKVDLSSEKINALFTQYDSILNANTNGWKMVVYPDIDKYPNNKGGFSFFMKFDKDQQRVSMISDAVENNNALQHSKYAIKFHSLTTLSFATYSPLHVVADPDIQVNAGKDSGWGNRIDSEYSFLKITPKHDTIFLKGNLQNTRALLIKATAEESEYFSNGNMYKEITKNFSKALNRKYGLHLNINNRLTSFQFSLHKKQATFLTKISEDSLYLFKTGLTYLNKNTIILKDPFIIDGTIIDHILIDDDNNLKILDRNQKQIEIVEKEFPMVSAIDMFKLNGYHSIELPYDNTNFIKDFKYEESSWPHYQENTRFFQSINSSFIFPLITFNIRIHRLNLNFNSKSKKMFFKVDVSMYNKDVTGATEEPSASADERWYIKLTLDYQFAYYAKENAINLVFEGYRNTYSKEFKNLAALFFSKLIDDNYTIVYTKSENELLVALYNIKTGEYYFEGRPY